MTDRRLYIFDIDGTLISTGGAGSAAMRAAFASLWRRPDGFNGVEFSGRTDRAIFRDAFMAAALDAAGFDAEMRRFKRSYFRRLKGTLVANKGRVLPGVSDLLTTLAADGRATIALGTGNFRTGAAMKLAHYGLGNHFQLGGFGDRTEERPPLIAQAIRAAQRAAGRHATVFVIGDTPHDVTAAKANGVIAVGVATGTASEEELAAAGADIVLPTLEGAARALA